MYPTAQAPAGQPRARDFLVAPGVNLRLALATCSHAQSLTAHDLAAGQDLLFALTCKQWKCRFCAQQKIRVLAAKTNLAKPNRLLTLTVDPAQWKSPRHAFDGTRRKVPELMQLLRRRYGEIEYLRITELHLSGYPHYHLLIRSDYIPQPVIKALWKELTSAVIVDVRKTDSRLGTYWYLVKYLSKLHKIEWTERHVSYSRGFFPKEEKPDSPYQLEQKQHHAMHPASYLNAYMKGALIKNESQNCWSMHSPNPPNTETF